MSFSTRTFKLCCLKRLLNHKGKLKWHHSQRSYNTLTGNRNVLELHKRGIFQNVFPEESSAELQRKLVGSPQCFYCGFDPTADSLHVGNLLALMALLHCHRGGHEVMTLLGGATACIGDPSGRTKDRQSMDADEIYRNATSIKHGIERIFKNHQKYLWNDSKKLLPARIVNNAEWYSERGVIEFLSTVGRHFRMGDLLGRHSVRSRLASPEGMNFTEFTYQVFQSYDWLHLLKKYSCQIQIGGNDQFGNIVSGHDFIHKVAKTRVYGLTVPLITTASGEKLGKSAGNAVWLNPDRTSPFHFYQYFVQQPDADVEKYLRLFTFLHENDITEIMNKHWKKPESWWAQKKLAEQVTLLVHGEEGLVSAKKCTEALYQSSAEALAALSQQEMQKLFQNASVCDLILEPGTTIMDVVMKAGCFSRKVDADRIIRAGGVYMNYRRVSEPDYVLIPGEHILPSGVTLIRIGKKTYYLIRWL